MGNAMEMTRYWLSVCITNCPPRAELGEDKPPCPYAWDNRWILQQVNDSINALHEKEPRCRKQKRSSKIAHQKQQSFFTMAKQWLKIFG